MTKYPRPSILCVMLTLVLWNATATPSQADTGTLRVVFGKAGLVAAVGSGEGILTFHGKHYPFLVVGGSIGATLAASTSVLHGTALNISTPSDLAGTYTGVGGGAAVAAGVSGVRLRNEKGVVLDLRGAKLGVEVSANLALITITMKLCGPSVSTSQGAGAGPTNRSCRISERDGAPKLQQSVVAFWTKRTGF